MNHLSDICSGSGDFNSMTLDQLRQQCRNAGQAFGLSWVELALLIVSMLVGFFWLLAARQRADEKTAIVVGNTFEGVLYAAIGTVAGSGFGLWFAEIVPPRLLGFVLGAVGLVAFYFAARGAVKGDGDAGGRVVAFILGVLLAGVMVVLAILAFIIPTSGAAGSDYEHYLNAVAIVLGFLGALDGIVAALLRGPKWYAGWALAFVNSSWGFLGNILGLGNHLGSYLCWANDGDPNRSNRVVYTLYRRGLTMLVDSHGQRFAFTQGWVMSCGGSSDLETHEAIHVTQHFVLGPIYVISHGIWDVLGALIGIGGSFLKYLLHHDDPTKQVSVGDAITNVSYYDNPYEIMAYIVPGARDDKLGEPLILTSPWSYLFMTAWIGGAIVAFALLMAHWT